MPPALTLAKTISIGELARRYGDGQSEKAFHLEDYKMYLLNNYLDETYNLGKRFEGLIASVDEDDEGKNLQ